MDEDWDFKEVNTKYQTHGLLYYPARMIPQIARRLLLRYSAPGDLVLDPFVGSGTTLVEARLTSRNAIGIDINPFSVLLARVKSTPILEDFKIEETLAVMQSLKSTFQEEEYQEFYPKLNHVNEWMEKWFPSSVIADLLIAKRTIFDADHFPTEPVRDFFKLMFSKMVLEVFKGKYDGSSTHIDKNKKEFSSNFYQIFSKHLNEGARALTEFSSQVTPSSCLIYQADFLEFDMNKLQPINLILTSPPYGEEKNTIGYSRWTKFPLYWLDFTQPNVLNYKRKTLGASAKAEPEIESQTLKKKYNLLNEKGIKHLREVKTFFYDYALSLKKMAQILETGKLCCIVCGNRRVSGEYFPMDTITAELASPEFDLHALYKRNIPSKTIPWQGISGETIKKENIIILCRK